MEILEVLLAYTLRVYVLPIIILVGSFFNLFLFFVMRRFNTPISIYLQLLPLADTCVLLSGGLNLWLLAAFNWSFIQLSSALCKISTFFISSMLDFSVALIVIMTAERLYAVVYPFEARKSLLNKNKKIMVISLAFVFCQIVNIHFLFSHSLIKTSFENMTINNGNFSEKLHTSSHKFCSFMIWNAFYSNYWIYINSVVYSFLPFMLLTGFNVSIFFCIKKAKEQRVTLSQPVVKYSNSSKMPKKETVIDDYISQSIRRLAVIHANTSCAAIVIKLDHTGESKVNTERNILASMFLNNICFCLFTTPIVILQIINENTIKNQLVSKTEHYNNVFDLLKSIAEVLQYLNHSINFFLYCLCGTTYRAETKRLISNIFNQRDQIN
jgi:hypothetical protein